jgi:indole-3-glycerol phosphate synthase
MSVSSQTKRRGKILDEIMRYHREQLPKLKREVPEADLRALSAVAPPPYDFYRALSQSGVTLIAECKKASPSKGVLLAQYDPVALAQNYEDAGAGAISVLTDDRHFQGSLSHLRDVRESVKIPILRKDFIFDPYQVYESRAAGADALLLLAAVLEGGELRNLLALTKDLGIEALVEVHTELELAQVLPLGPRVVGINNRNLQTFQVDFENTARLRAKIPQEIVVVAESGIQSPSDVRNLAAIGVDAILVGESLVKNKDPLAKARELVLAGKLK